MEHWKEQDFQQLRGHSSKGLHSPTQCSRMVSAPCLHMFSMQLFHPTVRARVTRHGGEFEMDADAVDKHFKFADAAEDEPDLVGVDELPTKVVLRIGAPPTTQNEGLQPPTGSPSF